MRMLLHVLIWFLFLSRETSGNQLPDRAAGVVRNLFRESGFFFVNWGMKRFNETPHALIVFWEQFKKIHRIIRMIKPILLVNIQDSQLPTTTSGFDDLLIYIPIGTNLPVTGTYELLHFFVKTSRPSPSHQSHSLAFGRTEPAVWINFKLFS